MNTISSWLISWDDDAIFARNSPDFFLASTALALNVPQAARIVATTEPKTIKIFFQSIIALSPPFVTRPALDVVWVHRWLHKPLQANVDVTEAAGGRAGVARVHVVVNLA